MTQIQLSMPDYLVVAGYFVIVLWIGFYFRNRLEAASDYFAGGRQVPWWLAGISHYMSSFSAFAFIAYAQMAYMYGWVSVTLFWVTIPGCLAGGLFFATDDCRASFEELKGRGVEFQQEPTEQPYGIDAGFRDPSGNQMRMAQLAPHMVGAAS